jgi:phosphosulfolactate synthase (CoM biosynthesis protein A)
LRQIIGANPMKFMSLTPHTQEGLMIRKRGDKFIIYSKKGKKLGEEPSRKKAEDRLRQIEYFANTGKKKK